MGELVSLTCTTEVAEIVFAGGAGYGNPHARPAARVASDLADRRISPCAARDIYGVDLSAQGAK